MTPIRTSTPNGVRVSFTCPPRHSDAPKFAKDHPWILDDRGASAQFHEEPFGCVKGRLWMSNGRVYSVKPPQVAEVDDEQDEAA